MAGGQRGQEVLQALEQIPQQPVEKSTMLPPHCPWMTMSEKIFTAQPMEDPMSQEVDVP